MGDELGSGSDLAAEVEALRARVRELEARFESAPEPARQPPLQLLLENSPDSITVMDLERHLLYLNRTITPRTLLEQVLGKDALEFIPPQHQAPFQEAFERAVRLAEVQQVEVSSQSGLIWETRLVPLVRADRVFAVMGIGANVTERRLAEQALRQAQKLEAIGRLTAGIAHNFNNMLLVILTNLRLCHEAANEALMPWLGDADCAAQRAAEMVRELMVFARQRPLKIELLPASLPELAARAVALCRTTFDPRVDLQIAIEGPIAPVRVDVGRVEQALVNILLNARDALQSQANPKPAVQVLLDMAHMQSSNSHEPLSAVRLRVRDNGPGMSEAVRTRVFEPFFTTKEVDQGTGLGLASVYGTMIEHEGSITCESQPAAGATFTLLFPVR